MTPRHLSLLVIVAAAWCAGRADAHFQVLLPSANVAGPAESRAVRTVDMEINK